MPSKYEIIQMINNQFARSPKDTIEEINELIEDIDNDPKAFTYELAHELEDWSKNLELCPLCAGNIVQISKGEESSEYFGQPVSETLYTYGCENTGCGYMVE